MTTILVGMVMGFPHQKDFKNNRES